MILEPKTLVSGFVHLTSLPEIHQRISAMLEKPDYSNEKIGQLIGQDPGLSARLLRIANSPFYGFPSNVDTISRAITLIGSRDLNDIILATSVTRLFQGISNDLVDMDSFWRHSIYTASAARQLSVYLQEDAGRERCFLIGLLHDIGSLLIYNKLPEQAREALLRSRYNHIDLRQAELEVIGFDHAQVGAELLRAWRLPAGLIEGVEYHHNPGLAPDYAQYAEIAFLANSLANSSDQGKSPGGKAVPLNQITLNLPGLTTSLLKEAQAQAEQQFESALQIIMPTSI
jgi:putative nucleotidyltransferase with HDIG domain